MRTIGLLVIALLILPGCHTPAPTPAPRRPFTPPPRVTEFQVKDTSLVNGAVTVRLEIPSSPAGPKPAVIDLIGDTNLFVSVGIVAVSYKINWALLTAAPVGPPPPKTVGKWVLASPSAAVLGQSYIRSIAATATEYVPAIVDWLETVPDVDPQRIGIVGASTNGFVTLQAAAADPRIRVAVSIAACGDYHGFLQHSAMGMEGKPLALDPAYERWLRRQEIIRNPRRMVHTALLLVNRSGDELIPISCADETARVLGRAYARARAASRFRYLRLEEVGHGMSVSQRYETMAWFQDWLQRP